MTTSDERALLDTNIVVYAADAGSPFHVPAKELRDRGFRGELPLVISPQVLLEFFAVITNPRRVQTPRSPQEATAEMAKYMRSRRIRMIYPGADILRRVLALRKIHRSSRVPYHLRSGKPGGSYDTKRHTVVAAALLAGLAVVICSGTKHSGEAQAVGPTILDPNLAVNFASERGCWGSPCTRTSLPTPQSTSIGRRVPPVRTQACSAIRQGE